MGAGAAMARSFSQWPAAARQVVRPVAPPTKPLTTPRRRRFLLAAEGQGVETPAQPSAGPSAFIRKLDASTKWLVTVAQTTAVIWRHDLASPFMVIGAVLAAYVTSVLKRIVNQRRPPGAPFTDPGMPSAHALVSTFISTAWVLHIQSFALAAVLLPCAIVISVLRVVCGYHTWAQIGVGAAIGGVMAIGWMSFGSTCILPNRDVATTAVIYVLYLIGSVAFVSRQLRREKVRRSST